MVLYSAVTDKGICDKNDDRIMVNGEIAENGVLNGSAEDTLIATICDGVGGYAFGDEAALAASRVFSALAGKVLCEEAIAEAIDSANTDVLDAQAADIRHRDMATTVAGVYIRDPDLIVFNVGDTRVFRMRNAYLSQLSVDHTFLQESLDLGMISAKEQLDERDRHKITRYIGDKHRCLPSITLGRNRVFGGDIFLICSDGLCDVVSNDRIEDILNMPSGLSARCGSLLQASLQNGSADNISIILLEAV